MDYKWLLKNEGESHMLADGKVYEQSLNLIIKAANYYYIESMSQSEIAKKLDISMLIQAKRAGVTAAIIGQDAVYHPQLM